MIFNQGIPLVEQLELGDVSIVVVAELAKVLQHTRNR